MGKIFLKVSILIQKKNMLKIRKLIWRRKKRKRSSDCLQSKLGLKLAKNSKRKKSSQTWDQYTLPTAAGKRENKRKMRVSKRKKRTKKKTKKKKIRK